MRDLLFHLQRDSRTPLQVQLREQLVSAILQGQIPLGSPLPPSRKLAETLDVARNTVAVAYQELVADGFLVAQERRGYFINGEILRGRAPAMTVARKQAATPDWARRLKLRPTSQRNIIKPTDWQSYRYPFIYGQIDPTLFPLSEWRECSRQALSVEAVNDWTFDHYTEDDPLLVEQIRTRYRADRSDAVPAQRMARMLAPGLERRGGERLDVRPLHRGRSPAGRADPHPISGRSIRRCSRSANGANARARP